VIAIFPELVACANERNIEELAKLVLRYFASGKFQRRISMEKVAERFGIKINRRDGNSLGMIAARDEKGKFSIGCAIKSNLPFAEEQFLIAHLFGHFLLHIQGHIARGEWGSSGFKESDSPLQRYLRSADPTAVSKCDPKDIEADNFAANLLMPSAVIHRSIAAKIPHQDLANLLGTTPAAVGHRIFTLQPKSQPSPSSVPVQAKPSAINSDAAGLNSVRQVLTVDRSKRTDGISPASEPVISAKGMDRIRELASRLAKPQS
jgi:IrrE N-terminal-like domain